MEEAREVERRLILLLESPHSSRREVLDLISALPAGEKFFLREKWIELSGNDSLESWRRIESYKILLKHGIAYPCDFSRFFAETIAPYGIDQNRLVNMSKAQHVPFESKGGELIYMAQLPIRVASGPASVYFAVDRPSNSVVRAGVAPDSVDPDSPENKGI